MKKEYFASRLSIAAIIIIIFALYANLTAQRVDDDQLVLKSYRLPQLAVQKSNPVVRDSLLYLNDKLFSGTLYERYPNGQLKEVIQYKNGIRHGAMYIWYPDGKAQLMATYRQGILSGRFKGWYQHGDVIYDLVLNNGKLSSDFLYDSDSGRRQETEVPSTERDGGVDNDQEQHD